MRHYNIPIFINHIGCPNSCVFCSQKKINGQETDTTVEEVLDIIKLNLSYLPEKSYIEVAFFGGTFTGLSYELQRKYLEVVKPFIEEGRVKGVRISTRPDCIDEKILLQLKKYGVKVIELGVQSLNQEVLDLTERNYKVEVVEKAVLDIKKQGFEIGIQMMIGLPGSDFNKEIETAEKIIKMKPHMVRIYPTLVLSGTEMENMYLRGEYKPYSLEEAVEIGVKVYSSFELNNIKIIRVGLQPSEELQSEGVIIAGPFHPSFRDLIEGEIYYNFLKSHLGIEENLKVEANEKNISKIIGNQSINKKRFKGKLCIKINNSISLEQLLVNNKLYSRVEVLKKAVN